MVRLIKKSLSWANDRILGRVCRFNDWIAIRITLAFGTMWMTYIFFASGFLPWFFPKQQEEVLYISNTIQLWALPLIMTGQNLLGHNTERLIRETHDMVESNHDQLMQIVTTLIDKHDALHQKVEKIANESC